MYDILAAKDELVDFKKPNAYNPDIKNSDIYQKALQSGLISNSLAANLKSRDETQIDLDVLVVKFEIAGMWCPSCAKLLELLISKEAGVKIFEVDYFSDIAKLTYYPQKISEAKVKDLIISLGYKANFKSELSTDSDNFALFLRFVIAAFFSVNIMMLSYPIYVSLFDIVERLYVKLFQYISLGCSLPVIVYCAYPIWSRAYQCLKARLIAMEFLVSVAVLAAFTLSVFNLLTGKNEVYFDSSSVIITFVLLGKLIESKAKGAAKTSLRELYMGLPLKARLLIGDKLIYKNLTDVNLHETMLIRQGEKIGLDGTIIEGDCLVDESIISGESKPIHKEKGDKILAGAILIQGSIKAEVTKSFNETTLMKVVNLIKEQVVFKPTNSSIVDKLASWFTPLVIVLAISKLLTAFFTSDWSNAIIDAVSVLLISCPCAIGIAVPLSHAYLYNQLLKEGVVVKNGQATAEVGSETCFVFDKTGTLTDGKFLVHLPAISLVERRVLKALTSKSKHPIAQAIFANIEDSAVSITNWQEIPGAGLKATYQNFEYRLGSEIFVGSSVEKRPLESETISSQVFFKTETTIYVINLGDSLRDGALQMIDCIKGNRVVLISGDSYDTVSNVARLCNIKEFYAAKAPADKQLMVARLKAAGEKVFMVGDGINDAPALTTADISAVTISASDISSCVADFLLTTPNLAVLLKLKKLCLFSQKIGKQNLFWAFIYNFFGILLALVGFLTPIYAALAMVASSLSVTINSKRLLHKSLAE